MEKDINYIIDIIAESKKSVEEVYANYLKTLEEIVVPFTKKLWPIFSNRQYEKINEVKNSDIFKLIVMLLLFDRSPNQYNKLPKFLNDIQKYEDEIDQWDAETLEKVYLIINSDKKEKEVIEELLKTLGFEDEEFFLGGHLEIMTVVSALIFFKTMYRECTKEYARQLVCEKKATFNKKNIPPFPPSSKKSLGEIPIPLLKIGEQHPFIPSSKPIDLAVNCPEFRLGQILKTQTEVPTRNTTSSTSSLDLDAETPTKLSRREERELESIMKKAYKDAYDRYKLDELIRSPISALNNLYEDNKKKYLKIQKVFNMIDQMIEDQSILDIEKISSNLWNNSPEKLKYCLARIVNINLSRKYSTLMSNRRNQTENDSFIYQLFKKNKISYDKTDSAIIESLNQIGEEKINKCLEILNNLGFNFSESINIIVDYNHLITDNAISLIKELLNKEVLSSTIIKNNLLTFLKNQDLIINNYKIIKENMSLYIKRITLELLLIDNNLLKDRIGLLNEYNISVENFTYLINNIDKIVIFDLMIENEIPEDYFIEIAESSNPILTIKKILLCIEADEPYITSKGSLYKSVIIPDRFACSDEKVDQLLLDLYFNESQVCLTPATTVKELDLVKYMDNKYRIDDNTYFIAGINFSRPKFLRNMQQIISNLKSINLDNKLLIIYALTSNSIVPKNILDRLQSQDLLSLKK